MTNRIEVMHSAILLHGYELGECPKLEKKLSIWMANIFTLNALGYSYDEDLKILRIPRGINSNWLYHLFEGVPINVIKQCDEAVSISIKVNVPPKNDTQRQGISFLTGEGSFTDTKKYSQALLNLQTGKGKTYITISSIAYLGKLPIIIVPTDIIRDQWIQSFLKFSDVKDSQIGEISGSGDMEYLMEKKKHKFKVFIVNHRTIQSFAKKHGWEKVHEFFKIMKIGIKVFDEAHLNFDNMLKIDHYTNVYKTFYLTATFNRSDKDEDKLFQYVFQSIAKFSISVDKYSEVIEDDYRKHVIYTAIIYNSHPSLQTQMDMKTNYGFNKNRYANYLKECDQFYRILSSILDKSRNTAGKILILSSSIASTETIKKFIEENNFGKTVATYHSKLSKAEKENAKKCDIICSTPQSAGTGFDLPGLKILIMTESYVSPIEALQVSGRLRELNSEEDTLYFELVDKGFKRVWTMFRERIKVFKQKCKKVFTYNFL